MTRNTQHVPVGAVCVSAWYSQLQPPLRLVSCASPYPPHHCYRAIALHNSSNEEGWGWLARLLYAFLITFQVHLYIHCMCVFLYIYSDLFTGLSEWRNMSNEPFHCSLCLSQRVHRILLPEQGYYRTHTARNIHACSSWSVHHTLRFTSVCGLQSCLSEWRNLPLQSSPSLLHLSQEVHGGFSARIEVLWIHTYIYVCTSRSTRAADCQFNMHCVFHIQLQAVVLPVRMESPPYTANTANCPIPTSTQDTPTPQPLPPESSPSIPNNEDPPEYLPPPGSNQETLPLLEEQQWRTRAVQSLT